MGTIDPRATNDDRVTARAAAREAGRAARKVLPRRTVGQWDPSGRERSAREVLRDQDVDRVTRLLPIRYGRMAASPWTYLRGVASVIGRPQISSSSASLRLSASSMAST